MKTNALLAVSVLGAALLAGCGGGGDGGGTSSGSGVPTGTPEGVYGGTVTGAPGNDAFRLVVLDGNNSSRPFWLVYGNVDPTLGFVATGLVQGAGATTAFANVNTFLSFNALEFSNSQRKNSTLSSSYTVAGNTKTIAGTVTTTGNPVLNIGGGAIPGATYNYDTAASLATVAGTWDVTGLDNDSYDLVVASDGTFAATPDPLSGCAFSGSLTPRASSGKNIFNVTLLTANSMNCAFPNEASSGIAMAYTAAGRTQLILAVTENSARLRGAAVSGLLR